MDYNEYQEDTYPTRWIKVADGTRIPCGIGRIDNRTIRIMIDKDADISITKAFNIFTDPSVTAHIEVYVNDEQVSSLDGYVRFYSIKLDDSDRITVGLRKPNE